MFCNDAQRSGDLISNNEHSKGIFIFGMITDVHLYLCVSSFVFRLLVYTFSLLYIQDVDVLYVCTMFCTILQCTFTYMYIYSSVRIVFSSLYYKYICIYRSRRSEKFFLRISKYMKKRRIIYEIRVIWITFILIRLQGAAS